MSTKSWAKFIFLGVVCGSTFLCMKLALGEINPTMLVFFRVFFASIGLGLFFFFTRRRLQLRWWRVYAFIGFFNVALPFVLISWAETHISSGVASILNSTVPIFTMLIASIFYKEDKLTLSRAIALMIGLLGVFLLSSAKLAENAAGQLFGFLAMLVAACCYGASAVFVRRVKQFVSPENHAIGQVLAALAFMTPAMLITNSPINLPKVPTTWLALLWMGLIVSFVAQLVWFRMIYEIGPSRASMISYMFPLVGVLLGVIFLGEKVTWRIVIGGLLILTGIYIVNSKRIEAQPTPAEVHG